MPNALILTAAGSSTRMGDGVKKEYRTVSESADGLISVLSSALYPFLSTGLFSCILITIPPGGEAGARRVLSEDRRIGPLIDRAGIDLRFAEGGSTRQASVRNGLEALEQRSKEAGDRAHSVDTVLIHDGARPWVSPSCIRAVLECVALHGAAVPAVPSVDTQKETDDQGRIVRHLDRSRVVCVQTPQGFGFRKLLEAHRKAAGDGREYTDDTEIWGRYAGDVYVCAGDRENRKITFRGDI